MALTASVDQVDRDGRELLTYGTPDFPIAFFDDDLKKVAVPAHWHNEMEIVMITEGIVHVRMAGSSFVLTAGEGYFANSGILHSATLASEDGHQHALVFSPRMISQADDLVWKSCVSPVLGNPHLPYIRLSSAVPWQEEALTLAQKAWDYGAYDKAGYPLQVRYCLSQVFFLIAANADMAEEGKAMYTSQYRRGEIRVKKALLFIEKNYAEDITIHDIAQSAEVSVSTCLRLFKMVLDTTPVQYLIRHRLQKAAEAIKVIDGRNVADVAYSCGFSDASYFDRCFRKAYGMTPSEFLKSS